MSKIQYALIVLSILVGLGAAIKPGEKVASSNGALQRGTSVVCPDNTSQWVCSISSAENRNAPPPLGVPVVAEQNAQGRFTITILKTDLPPDASSAWFQSNNFYTPQTIEIQRSLSLSVLGLDASKFIDPGFYPIVETETTYQVIF
jgi:hypothetical protein